MPGEFGAVYLSLKPETALRELARRALRAGIPVGQLMPRDLLTVELRLQRVLDLTATDVRTEWGIANDDLRSDDFTACQEVAAAARRAGYEAIRYPAAVGTGENLVLFFDRLHPGSSALVRDTRSIGPESVPQP